MKKLVFFLSLLCVGSLVKASALDSNHQDFFEKCLRSRTGSFVCLNRHKNPTFVVQGIFTPENLFMSISDENGTNEKCTVYPKTKSYLRSCEEHMEDLTREHYGSRYEAIKKRLNEIYDEKELDPCNKYKYKS